MKTLFTKIRFILSSVVCIAGAVYVLAANDILQIPTTPADHKATLVDVQLGIQGNGEQWIKMGQNREVLIAGGLIAGEVSKNQIDNSSNATIGGGGEPAEGNLIQGGNNSFIGAGIWNKIYTPDSSIGGGFRNIIQSRWQNSFIGGGDGNTVNGMYSTIGGGDTNTISANYSVIPGGSNNVIEAGADYSFAAGSETKAKHPGSFLWSDWDKDKYEWKLETTKPNTFLIRSLNGMSINTPDAIPGVNVNIAGPVQIGSEGLLGTPCSGEDGTKFAGTYEYSDGCMYFCDGKYWQLLNITNPSNVARCGEDSQYKENIAYTFCYLYLDLSEEKPYQMEFRAGDSVEAYKEYASNSCESAANKQKITCQQDGTRYPKGFEYINCTPWIVYLPTN